MVGVTDGVGARVAVLLGAGVSDVVGDAVEGGMGAVEGAASETSVAVTGVAVAEARGVEVGRGVRVGVGRSGVSGAAQAVKSAALQKMTSKRLGYLNMARILELDLLLGEYITVRRRVKIDSPFDMCAEID